MERSRPENLAFIRTVRDVTLLHGPSNLIGPIKYVPFGITRFTEPDAPHASFHAALKAWNESISSIIFLKSNKLCTLHKLEQEEPERGALAAIYGHFQRRSIEPHKYVQNTI